MVAVVVDFFLRDQEKGLHLGPCLTLVQPKKPTQPSSDRGVDLEAAETGNKAPAVKKTEGPALVPVQTGPNNSEWALYQIAQTLLSDARDIKRHAALINSKRVLLRADLNLPVNEETGEITDATRLKAVLPTVQFLVQANAKVRSSNINSLFAVNAITFPPLGGRGLMFASHCLLYGRQLA
jgi:hypothetical protein